MKNKSKYVYSLIVLMFLVSFGMIGSYFGNHEETKSEVVKTEKNVVINGDNNGINLECNLYDSMVSHPFRIVASTLTDAMLVCLVSDVVNKELKR